MHKFGLALSGGGFRASLYHLGVVRFLRDAGILPRITHITSVSGGSVFAAHLVWDEGFGDGWGEDFSTLYELSHDDASELLFGIEKRSNVGDPFSIGVT